ncbi:MAG: hypothetical protein CMP23_16495 [Rickettsiales bacterium]|nr:hypothetical protein [Rickettsiales bacterium]
MTLCTLALLLLVCTEACKPTEPGQSAAPDGLSPARAFVPEAASQRQVRLSFSAEPGDGLVTPVLMGFEPEQMEGDWAREGERPKLYWLGEATESAFELSFEAPLLAGLVYLVAVDRDGNLDVNRGDLVSAPRTLPSSLQLDEVIEFVVDRPFSPGPEPGGMDLAARPTTRGGEPRQLRVETSFGLSWLRSGQLMVVGVPLREQDSYQELGRRFPPRVAPSFLWVAQRRALRWPMELEALVPDGLDVFVVLDLDDNGYPSTGDVSSLCACDLERPPVGSGPLTFVLESVVPSNEELADKFIFPDIDPPGEGEQEERGEEADWGRDETDEREQSSGEL